MASVSVVTEGGAVLPVRRGHYEYYADAAADIDGGDLLLFVREEYGVISIKEIRIILDKPLSLSYTN